LRQGGVFSRLEAILEELPTDLSTESVEKNFAID